MFEKLRVRRGAAAFVAVALLAVVAACVVPRIAAAGHEAAWVAAVPEIAAGGRVFRACAFGIGLVLGGALGMGANPLGGAAAISLGLHMAAFACT